MFERSLCFDGAQAQHTSSVCHPVNGEEITRLTVITAEVAHANVVNVVGCQNVMFLD